MSTNPISDDRLNAFVDDQLGASEKSEIFEAMDADSSISQRACELRQLGELVRHAYDRPPQSERLRKQKARRVSPFGRAAAATLLVGLGATLGWIGHQQPDAITPLQTASSMNAMFLSDEDRAFHSGDLSTVTNEHQLKRVIVHLNTSSEAKFEKALATAEQLLSTYADDSHGAEIELVANASAVKMLRSGHSPYAQRVRALQEKYFNLTFLACKDAMDHVREMENLDSDLDMLPDVEVTPSALEHILNRMNEGWVYLNV
jgi:intracellular sulfur oxidation DsrE/DsrF family protein